MDTTTIRHGPSAKLKLALQADATVVAIAGIALAAGADPIGNLLGFAPVFLRTIGIALLPWAAWVGLVGRRTGRTATRSVIAGNMLWVVASILMLVVQAIDPNRLGIAFVLLQAVLVAVIAWWQVMSQRPAQAG
ncbi:MAG: hypothetical protein QM589_15775 [Thermomicrobiales bacterium]